MSTIASQLFTRPAAGRDNQEQLLKLFWNRAELKKEFDKLRAEAQSLNEQVSKQEALTLRVQQRLDQLEALLANPDAAIRAMVYYQLRGIWAECHQRIASLAKDLERTCRDREYREHVAAFRDQMNRSLVPLQNEASRVGHYGDLLSADIKALRARRSGKSGVWNVIRRRRLTLEIKARRLENRQVQQRIRELNADIQAESNAEPPQFPGLSVASRRMINLRIIAAAQELCLHYADDEVANLAREASARKLTEVRYGSRRDCRELGAKVEAFNQGLESDNTLIKRVRTRAASLEKGCNYRNETDTVPIAESLGGIHRLDGEGQKIGQASKVNVLVDEYWDIFSVLFD